MSVISEAIKSLVAVLDNVPLSTEDETDIYVTIGLLVEYREE